MDNSKIKAHLKSDNHDIYEEHRDVQRQSHDRLTAALSNKTDTATNRRGIVVTNDTCIFQGRYVKVLLTCGIPIYQYDGTFRRFVESVSDDALDHHSNLKKYHVPRLIELEREGLEREVHGKKVVLIFDASPRMGEVFALIVRFVDTNASVACVKQRLIHVSFVRGSLNSHTQCGEPRGGLKPFHLTHKDATAARMDGCSANTKTTKLIEDHQYIK
jgi:hypothetical protein